MIKYNLICKNCDNSFDSWFGSSKEYDKLKRLKYINCYRCNSLNVGKNLMTPSVLSSKNIKPEISKNDKNIEVKNIIKNYKKFIKNNFEYVGENFAYKARLIYYDNKKKSKGIYGKASVEEIKKLKEEGIETELMPWSSEKDN
tara:strand:- start:409 stop:837 length:429 start_codon:yes stop_codon:yes gene_type:complete